jgi:hypothetical protein
VLETLTAVLKVCELIVIGLGKHKASFGNLIIVISSERKENPFFTHFKTVVVFPVSGGADINNPDPFLSRHAECKRMYLLEINRNRSRGSTRLT